jgi:formate hydrogenlyase subunit 4
MKCSVRPKLNLLVYASPVKLKFIRNGMNMVDLAAIIPFVLTVILESMEDIVIIGNILFNAHIPLISSMKSYWRIFPKKGMPL